MKLIRAFALVVAITTFVVVNLIPNTALCAEPLRVWVVGDSNGWLLMHELPAIAREHGVDLRGNPVGGASLFWWTDRENQNHVRSALRFKPDIVLVILGTNEAFMPASVRKTKLPSMARSLVARLGSDGARVFWVGPPRLPARREPGADDVRKIVTDLDLPLLDSRDIELDMWADHIHPSAKGRKAWARWIWDRLFGQH